MGQMVMNFDTILKDCKSRYVRFDKDVRIDRQPKSFKDAIIKKKEDGLNPVISEIKPSSPTGKIRDIPDPAGLAVEMIGGGACGISVLTEERYFGGSVKNLKAVSKAAEKSNIPVLRKDFIFDKSQVFESYYYGADSLLLISSFFDQAGLEEMIGISRGLGMEPLVEIHSIDDIKNATRARAEIFVINNRDKDTLKIDLTRSKTLSKDISGIKISASGISSPGDLRYVLSYCDAALIGTSIMKSDDIKKKVEELVHG